MSSSEYSDSFFENLPGVGGARKDLDIDDKHMTRREALFTSMTPAERLQPGVLDMSRRRRIARGSGQEVGAVNELLKRFKDMKKLMKQILCFLLLWATRLTVEEFLYKKIHLKLLT